MTAASARKLKSSRRRCSSSTVRARWAKPTRRSTFRPPRRRRRTPTSAALPTTTSRSRKDRMAQRTDKRAGERDQRGGRKRAQTGPIKRKSCFFCKDKVDEIDYKNINQLRRYISEKGKIRNRRITGACRRHQRQVAVAVKRAREMALLPYVTG